VSRTPRIAMLSDFRRVVRFLPVSDQYLHIGIADMGNREKSWRYFGLFALALVAGAVRFEEDRDAAAMGAFTSDPALVADAGGCDTFDPGWLGACTSPREVLLAGE
jgi:hypothetical protein